MKVGCEQCGASYSVADEKVAGRRLKLRCKKCGEPMVIDGTEPGSAQDSTPVGPHVQVIRATLEPEPAGESEWYVGIDDSAQGPYSLAEVAQYYAAGSIGPQTLVYREGLASWTPAAALPELHSPQPARRSLPPTPPRSAAANSARAALDRPIALGRDPFGDSAEPSPDVSAAELLRAGNREGTVRFSLDDIRALSAVSMPSLMPSAASRPGYASGGGSGLIDVRALTEAEAGKEAYRPISGMQVSPLDTMAPLVLPSAGHHTGVDLRIKVLMGLASFGFLLASGVAVFALTRPSPQPVASVPRATAAATAAPEPTAAMAAPKAAAAVVAPAPTPVPAALPAKPSAAPQPLAARDVRSAKTRKREARKAGTSARPSSPPARESAKRAPDIDDILVAKSPSAEKSPEKKSDATKGDSETGKSTGNPLDDLLLGALNGKKAAPKSADEPEAGGGLPQTPSRDQMMSVLGKAKAKVSKCKGTGVATANITIAGSGRVSNVAVAGVDGSAKSCVETAVRSTAFPKFQKDSFAVKFAFKLGGS